MSNKNSLGRDKDLVVVIRYKRSFQTLKVKNTHRVIT